MIDADMLQQILDAQRKQQEELVRQLFEKLTAIPSDGQSTGRLEPTIDTLQNSITEFAFSSGEDVTFDAWYRRYQDVFEKDAVKLEDGAKTRLLLRKLSTQVHTKYVNYILPRTPGDITFSETLKILTDMFGPQTSLFATRYKCLKLTKQADDDYVAYGGKVNLECERFKLGKLTNDQFKCLVYVCGLQSPNDAAIRLKLLNKIEKEPNTTLQELIEECKRLVCLVEDAKLVEQDAAKMASVIKNQPKRTSFGEVKESRSRAPRRFLKEENKYPRSGQLTPKYPCWLCGQVHFVRDCHFRRHRCQDCKQWGHKEGFCAVASKNSKRYKAKKKRSSGVRIVSAKSLEEFKRYAEVQINNKGTIFQIDTASDITIITHGSWVHIGSPPLRPTPLTALSASGQPLQFEGMFDCTYSFQGAVVKGQCYVSGDIDLLGVEQITALGIYPIMDTLSTGEHYRTAEVVAVVSDNKQNSTAKMIAKFYPEILEAKLGRCTKAKAMLLLKSGAKPVFRPKRPVPYAAQATINQELDRFEQQGVISKVEYSAWAAPIVVVKKANGKIRICADFSTGLNEALELHQYPLPVPEDIFATLTGGRYFSQIDFADAYLQVQVDEGSRELLTINTHRGLYRYNRLPFGVKSAPGIFQQIMDTMLAGLKGTVAYLDDVIVVGQTEKEHDDNLRKCHQVFTVLEADSKKE